MLCAGLALTWDEPAAFTSFGFATVVCATLGLVFALISKGGDIQLSLRRSIILLVFFWLAVPLLGAGPMMGIQGNDGWLRAYADAMSQMTTTGAKIVDPALLPLSFSLWQAGLQWLGGYASIVMALLVLAPLNMTAPGVHRSPFLTIDKGNVAGGVGLIARAMLLVYGGASALIWLGLIVTGTPAFSAVLLTMGSISTGGYWPEVGGEPSHIGQIGMWFSMLAMTFGALGFALHWDVIQRRVNYLRDPETIGLFILIISAGILFFLLGKEIIPSIQNAISLITTTAVPIGPNGYTDIPAPVVMALILVGGAAVSTAGGVKIIRFLLLFRQTGVELAKLSHPSSIQAIRYQQVVIGPRELVGLWAYVFGYAVVISILVILLGLGGTGFAEASQLAIATISNAGPAFTPASGIAGDFSALSDPMVLLLALAMALGRIEILAAVAILSPEFWRN